MTDKSVYIRWFDDVTADAVADVGGKNASLGEMVRNLKKKGVRVPDGFATTAQAYREFLRVNNLEGTMRALLSDLSDDPGSLDRVGRGVRKVLLAGKFPLAVEDGIRRAYADLCRRYGQADVDVAVRSSATAEDLPTASFAGQQETFLNITGPDQLLDACRRCYASLFTNRAISYRREKGFEHLKVALSIGIQKMVRSDQGSAGVMFSIDTETGFRNVVVINAAWGLGELVVQGAITPDEYVVFKPLLEQVNLVPIIGKSLGNKARKMVYAKGGTAPTKTVDTSQRERRAWVLTEQDILQLARWACTIETHYKMPMDMEWAKDGQTGELFIVQARPETVQSQLEAGVLKTYRLLEQGTRLVSGLSIGEAIAAGQACVIRSAQDIDRFRDGAILVTETTDPDWVPIMKRAKGIVTDHGGRTSHAAIVSRELGIPAIVGTGDATEVVTDGQSVTMSCAEGSDGYVYDRLLKFDALDVDLKDVPVTRTRIMLNIASPAAAFRWWQLPCQGIGLARMEFIINNIIKIHPMALAHFEEITDADVRAQIEDLTRGYDDKRQYFVDHLARGIAKIAASQYPEPVIVRMSDFKSNEYADLIGGRKWEPVEANPMLGLRGASRYYSPRYRDGFALECRAIIRVREEIGLSNVIVMIPFCRTPEEADRVLEVMATNGLKRGEGNLQIYVMAEIPSNVILAAEFAKRFDGFSIGSNDLTQLVLGVDRDSEELAGLFDERHEAVKTSIRTLITSAHQSGKKVGICGQAPSDYPDFAAFLVEAGIDSISLNPDSLVAVKKRVAEQEARQGESPRCA
jgi:pyruvate,water dikinase